MPAKSEHVYVIRGTGRNKVGIAANVERRLMFLRGDGAVEIVKSWHRPDDARAIEYAVRTLLGEHRAKGFEWFTVPVERLVEAVESAIEMVEAGTAPIAPSIQWRKRRDEHQQWWLDWHTEFDRLKTELDEWVAASPENAAEFEASMKKLRDN